MDAMFSQFKKADSDVRRVLLLDILLNGYSLENIEKIEQVTEHRPFAGFNRKVVRVFGLTKEAIDVKEIYAERDSMIKPIICSMQSFEVSTDSDVVYCHKAKGDEYPLKIHDLGIISPYMVITPDVVISSKAARPLNECEYGFTSFMEYILNNGFEISNWSVQYKEDEKLFEIYYTSKKGGNKELVFQSVEYGKEATFALVLYLIKKVYAELVRKEEKFTPDWFTVERWVREKGR